MAEESQKKDAQDVVLLHSPTEDGEGIRVLRAREERLEVGEVRPMREGKPIAGEVVRLKPRPSAPRLCDVEVLADVGAAAKHGPAQVASHAYRESWDRIFGTDRGDGAERGDDRAKPTEPRALN